MVMASYNIGSLTVYDTQKCKDQVLFVASCKSMKTPVKGQTLEKPKLAELKKLLCKSFIKPMTGPMITQKVASCYNEYSSH